MGAEALHQCLCHPDRQMQTNSEEQQQQKKCNLFFTFSGFVALETKNYPSIEPVFNLSVFTNCKLNEHAKRIQKHVEGTKFTN